jgi:nitroreductase
LDPSISEKQKTQNLLNIVPQILRDLPEIVPNVQGHQVVQLRSPEVQAQSLLNFAFLKGAFASMIILLGAVNESIGASFVVAFEDNEVRKILRLPVQVKPIGIIALGYPAERPERFERIELNNLVHYNTYYRTTQMKS